MYRKGAGALKPHKLLAVLCAILLCFALPCQALAGASLYTMEAEADTPAALLPTDPEELNAAAEAAAAWLLETESPPALGGETALLALLRGGWLTAQDEVAGEYLASLPTGLLQADEAYTLHQGARCLLALAALGISPADYAPALVARVCNAEGLAAEGVDSLSMAALAFGLAGIEAPESTPGAQLGIARRLIALQNEDGGFGADGESNAYSTALALQALAAYPTGEDAVSAAQYWQLQSQSSHGGFAGPDGADDPAATAEAVLALASLSLDPAKISYNTPSLTGYLLGYQNLDGSFAPAGSEIPDAELTALCLAALVAEQRYTAGKTSFYDFSDVVPVAPTAAGPEELDTTGQSLALILLALGILLVITLLCFAASHLRRKR